jgi:hypothetical protein
MMAIPRRRTIRRELSTRSEPFSGWRSKFRRSERRIFERRIGVLRAWMVESRDNVWVQEVGCGRRMRIMN